VIVGEEERILTSAKMAVLTRLMIKQRRLRNSSSHKTWHLFIVSCHLDVDRSHYTSPFHELGIPEFMEEVRYLRLRGSTNIYSLCTLCHQNEIKALSTSKNELCCAHFISSGFVWIIHSIIVFSLLRPSNDWEWVITSLDTDRIAQGMSKVITLHAFNPRESSHPNEKGIILAMAVVQKQVCCFILAPILYHMLINLVITTTTCQC